MLETHEWVTLNEPASIDQAQSRQPLFFIAEKVYDIHKDVVYLEEFQFKTPFKGDPPYTYESIVFGNGIVNQNTLVLSPHLSDPHLIQVSYELQIPFILTVLDKNKHYYIANGHLPKLKNEMTLRCPHNINKYDLHVIVETKTKTIGEPDFEFDQIAAKIESRILTKLVGPIQLLLPEDSANSNHLEESPSLFINPAEHAKGYQTLLEEIKTLRKRVKKEMLKSKHYEEKLDSLEKKLIKYKKELKHLKQLVAEHSL